MSVPRLIWKRGLDSPNLASKVKPLFTFVFSEVVRQNLRISIDTLRLFRYFPSQKRTLSQLAIRQDGGDLLEQEA